MATAEELRKEFSSYLEEMDVRYEVLSGQDNILMLGFAGDPDKQGGGINTSFAVDFDEDGDESDSVHIQNGMGVFVAEENRIIVLSKLNEINSRYRWAKFYIKDLSDGRSMVLLNADSFVYPLTVGPTCLKLVAILKDITEDVLIELGDLVEIQ